MRNSNILTTINSKQLVSDASAGSEQLRAQPAAREGRERKKSVGSICL